MKRVDLTVLPSANPTQYRPHRHHDPRSATTVAPSRRSAANTDTALPPPPPRARPGTAAPLRRCSRRKKKQTFQEALASPSQRHAVMVRLCERAEKTLHASTYARKQQDNTKKKNNTVHQGTKQTPGKIKKRVKTPATRPPMATARPYPPHAGTNLRPSQPPPTHAHHAPTRPNQATFVQEAHTPPATPAAAAPARHRPMRPHARARAAARRRRRRVTRAPETGTRPAHGPSGSRRLPPPPSPPRRAETAWSRPAPTTA